MQLLFLFLVPLAVLAGAIWLDATYGTPGRGHAYVVRLDLPPAGMDAALPEVRGPRDARRPLVVLDAGHGGHDPGSGKGSIREKTVALQISSKVRDILLDDGGIRVAMTRETDQYFTLAERFTMARKLGADLFVSIHADSVDSNVARGASVYVLSEKGSTEAAEKMAARENAADTLNGVSLTRTDDTVDAILLDLSQRETQTGSAQAARLLLRELRGTVRLHREQVQSAAFGVLKAPDMPSILFETGFISNPSDEAYLTSEEGQAEIARAAAQAIRVYFARRSDS
ncbi:hypothetical protein GCM10011371_04010 [Novosphingobium marinum]|nr:hypothetical protein GCM10011371_04010 [Novosphingobium marinum]